MSLLSQIKRYLTVGLGSALTDFSVYGLLLHFAGWPPEVANLISRPCGGLFSFAGNKLWTFKRRQLEGTHRELARFWTVWLVSYLVSEVLVWLFHIHFRNHPGLPDSLSNAVHHLVGLRPDLVTALPKLCAECLVGLGLFLSHRFWTFRAP